MVSINSTSGEVFDYVSGAELKLYHVQFPLIRLRVKSSTTLNGENFILQEDRVSINSTSGEVFDLLNQAT